MDTTTDDQRYAQAVQAEANEGLAESVRLLGLLIKAADPPDPRFFIALGSSLQRLGHWQQAIEPLSNGIALKPHYAECDARLMLAESLLKTGQIKKAIKQWKIVAHAPSEYPSYDIPITEAMRMLAKYE